MRRRLSAARCGELRNHNHSHASYRGHLFTMPNNDPNISWTILYGETRPFIHHFSRMHRLVVNNSVPVATGEMPLLVNPQ
jgi:hypothetical protein